MSCLLYIIAENIIFSLEIRTQFSEVTREALSIHVCCLIAAGLTMHKRTIVWLHLGGSEFETGPSEQLALLCMLWFSVGAVEICWYNTRKYATTTSYHIVSLSYLTSYP